MNQIGLFLAGGAVTLIVFIGVLIYGYMSFNEWSNRTQGDLSSHEPSADD